MSGYKKWADIAHKVRTEACKHGKHHYCGQYAFPNGQLGGPTPCQCSCHEVKT